MTKAFELGELANYANVNVAANSLTFDTVLTVASINAAIVSSGTLPPSVLPQANSTSNGAVLILDSVTNTSIAVYAASANSVKTAYDAATNAYSNAVSVAASDATSKAATAYSNAVSTAAADATSKAATAYSNAVTQATTLAGAAYTNAVGQATSLAATAYSNAVSVAAADATSKAATAYSNAVSVAAADATSKAATAYSNAVAAIQAGTTFTGAVIMQANLTANNVRLNGSMQIDGNLTVSGTSVTLNVASLSVGDNMIYLNSNSTVSNPDLGFAGNYNDGTYRHAGFFRDATDGVWKVFHQYLPEPDASAYIDTSNASFALANLQAHTFIGNLSGDATSVGGNTALTLRTYSDTVAATAYSNAITFAANASNLSGGTLPAARLSGAYGLGNTTITGFANVTSTLQVTGPSQLSNTVTVTAGSKYVQMLINGNANLNSAGILNGGLHNGLIVGSYLDASAYAHTFLSMGYSGDDGRDFSIGTGSVADFGTATYSPRITVKPSGAVTFANATSTTVFLASNGNVGIGVSNPTTKLHVDGVLYATGAAVIGSYASVGSIVANDPGASYYAWNNRIGGGIALVGTTYVANNLVVGTTNLDVGGSVKGVRLSLDGKILASTDNSNGMFYDEPLYLDRRDLSGDGACIVLARHGQYKAAIGVISNGGSAEGSMTFSTATNSGYNNRMLLAANGNFGIATTTPGSTLSVRGSTNLGDSHSNALTATHRTRISGFALRYDASTRYGSYGQLIFNADTSWTAGARRYLITNGLDTGKFAIVRSADADTDPTLGDAGAISSGTADFVITNGGNIGIGTTGPAYKLDVVDSSYAVARFYTSGSYIRPVIQTAGTSGNPETSLHFTQAVSGGGTRDYYMGIYSPVSGRQRFYFDNRTSLPTDFEVNGSAVMTIAANGNVGIGTTGPATPLHIVRGNGITRMDNGDGNYSDWQQTGSDTRFGTQSNIPLDIYTNANRRIRIDGAGRVGVGVLPTSSWSGALSVLQIGDTGHIANFNGGTNQQMWVGHNNYYDGSVWRYLQAGTTAALYRQSNGDHQFYVANTAVTANSQISFRTGMVISNAGNVGVNVDSPSGVFHVYQTAGSMYMDTAGGIPRMRLGGGNGFGFNRLSASEDIFFGEPDDTGTWRVRGAGTISLGVGSSSTTMVVGGNGGNVGIGTTNPNAARLHVAGPSTGPDLSSSTVYHASAVLGNSDRDYGTYFATYGNGSGAIQQRRGASAVYYNLALQPHGGNVGIGTASPAEKLHLTDGKIAVSGDTTTPSTGHAFFYKQSAGATVSGYQAILETGSAGSRSTRLLIDFGGRMGLGTTTPWSHFTLSANSNNGSAIATNAADFGNSALIIHNQDDAGTGNKAALLFAHAGAPGLISGISSTKTSGTWQTSLDFYVNNTTGGANTGIIQHAMRIASVGNVLMGTTTNPTDGAFTNTRLLVKQIASGGTGGGIQIEQSDTDNVAYMGFTGSAFKIGTSYRASGSHQPIFFAPGNAQSLWLATDGSAGIGNTSPAERLHVQGNVRVFSSGYPYIDMGVATNNYFRLIHDNPNDRFVIGKNGSNHFIVDGAGGVYATGTRTRSDLGWTYGGTTTDYDGTYYAPWYKIFEYTSDTGNINVIMEIAVMADPNFGHGGVYNVMIMRHSNIGSEIRSIGVRHIGGKDNMLVLFNVGRIVYARSNALWGDGVYYRIISSAGAGSGSAANGQFPWALFGREANIPNYNGSNALVGQGWIYNGVPTDYTSTLNP